MRTTKLLATLAASTLGLLSAATAHAEPVRFHAQSGVAHAFSDPQRSELSWGAVGDIAIELPVLPVLGLQAKVGAVWLSDGDAPHDPGFADRGPSSTVDVMGGVRLQSGGSGLWADLNAGLVRTGNMNRLGLDTHVGYDFDVDDKHTWSLGPVLGYLHVVEPEDSLRPEDARVLWLGVHISFGAHAEPKAAPPPAVAPPPPEAPATLDAPAVVERQAEGAVATPASGPVRIEGDRILLDDVIHFDLDSPRVRSVSWPLVKKLARFIAAHPAVREVEIVGHADERGTEQHNLVLSRNRALAVRALLERYGVDFGRMTVRGLGTSKPRLEGHTEAEFRENRRVEFIVVSADASAPTPQASLQEGTSR